MKQILLIVFSIWHFTTLAQHTISGKGTDGKGNPILGANVYLEGTYDGSSTD